LCKTSNKATRQAIAAQEHQAALARQQADAHMAEQRKMHAEATALREREMEFNRQQAEYVRTQNEEMMKLASRPTPMGASEGAGQVQTGSDDQSSLDSRKRGRAALRIDLNAPQTAGNTGLNVPRG